MFSPLDKRLQYKQNALAGSVAKRERLLSEARPSSKVEYDESYKVGIGSRGSRMVIRWGQYQR